MKQTTISILTALLVTFFLPLSASCIDGNNITSTSIIIQDANLRSGPGTNSPIMTTLRQGTKIYTTQHQGQWVQVNISDMKKTGWVHSSLVEETSADCLSPQKILIGIIDIQRILNESVQGHAAKKKIEHQKSNNKNINVDLTIEENILSGIIMEIQAIVESYARTHGYTHILNKNSGSVFYHDALYDITNDIIEKYDHQVDENN